MTTPPILVGYDGSAGAQDALAWALDEAARTAAPVLLAYALELPTVPGPIAARPTYWPDPAARPAAESLIDHAIARLAGTRPEIVVRGGVYDGPSSVVLRERSRHASMVVLGSRGHGGFADLLVGSTTVAVSAHAHCPVVVVRGTRPGPDQEPRHVLVGLDGSASSQLALGFAAEQAAARHVPLRVLSTWTPPAPVWQLPAFDPAEVTAAEQHSLDELLTGWREKFPQLTVIGEVLAENAGSALITASRNADLVVVGSRGRGGFRGLLLGSVSQQLLHHSHCPVAIVRERQSATALA